MLRAPVPTPSPRKRGRTNCSSAIHRRWTLLPTLVSEQTLDESGNYSKSVGLWPGDLSSVVTRNESLINRD